ncbi:MAG TPA: DUF72 domain-containing protein [Pedobacter sp.]|jgi:uncharacterized protein YecE (DUF72 family)
MIEWRIGCSGFHYKHWKGTFYPEGLAQTKWFNHYCQYFSTLELNVTFYRFPRLSFLENWRLKSPENFRFAVKAPRSITHYKKFNGTADLISDFYNVVRDGLQDKLGCVLFQLPPNFHYSEEHLERIINSLDNSFLNVVEFRHPTWWIEEVYQKLAIKNITFCGMSHPTLPKDLISNTPLLYYRMHGEGQLYASNYENEQLQLLVDRIKSGESVKEAYIFFNNDIHTYAIYNALDMLKMI